MQIVHLIENSDTACPASLAKSETARLLELCAQQITAALAEAFQEIDALSCAFVDTARHANAFLGAGQTEERLQADSQALKQALRNANMRLQFADRMNQRLSNVASNLAGLADLMQPAEWPTTDIKWREFLKRTRASFTMEQERQMFDAVFAASATGAAQIPLEIDGNSGNEC